MISIFIDAVTEQKINISWETVIAVIGALAWLPWIFDKCSSSRIYGNVISYVLNGGTFNNKEGLLYFFKLSISCINKNVNIKSIDIYVKYPNTSEWKRGSIFWARTSTWTINNDEPQKKLTLPNDNFLGFINVLEKDKSNFYYLTFLVENTELQEFEKIKFEFVNHKNSKKSVEISREEIDEDRMLFDDSIWSS
ncbi:hypothetical protein [Flavobacterium soyae]|uniref:DUF4352 domain-containing protein n=1 Tax=Flavobacterium soyae TaxID=2903098 RepID=A0ABZ2ULV1_9FLAO